MASAFNEPPEEEGLRRGSKPGEWGQEPHVHDPLYARQIMEMGAIGMPINSIAEALGISSRTIRRHYATEWAQGRSRATAQLGKRLFEIAMAGNVDALKFLISRRAGYEPVGREGGDSQPPPDEGAGLKPVNVRLVFVETPDPGPNSLLPENPRFLRDQGETIDNGTGKPIDPDADGSR